LGSSVSKVFGYKTDAQVPVPGSGREYLFITTSAAYPVTYRGSFSRG